MLADHQHYDLILNPQTIPQLSDHPFLTYETYKGPRLVISDRDDGLWRINGDLVFYQSAGPAEAVSNPPGDQHTLSFDKAQNILIENLDIYAHSVEEALKFSACANVVVRNCRLVASRTSEDAVDIVRGQNYIFDQVWIVGLGDRCMTVKGSARFVDIIDSKFGVRWLDEFYEVFNGTEVTIGERDYTMGAKMIPRESIPNWAWACQLFSDDKSLALELGGWSDYDIGFINEQGILEERPPTSDIRIDAEFTDAMKDDCSRNNDLVPVLQWHTAKQVSSSGWVFNPASNSLFGDLVKDLYYEESKPGAAEEAVFRRQLGPELDYWNVELPRYTIKPGEYSNNRFFGSLYNWDNQFLYAPHFGWFYVFNYQPPGHDFMRPGTWIYHYPTAAWYLFFGGQTLNSAAWWNANDGQYYYGALD